MDEIKKHLTDGEEILWSQKPKYKLLNKYDFLTVPLTILLFGGISFLFTAYLYVEFTKNPGIAFYFFTAGLLVYLVSFYFIFGRFLYRRKRKNREQYILTNKRALIVTSLVYCEVEVVLLSKANIRTEKNSISFSEEIPAAEVFYNLGLDALLKLRPKRGLTFSGLNNPDEILKLISAAEKEGETL